MNDSTNGHGGSDGRDSAPAAREGSTARVARRRSLRVPVDDVPRSSPSLTLPIAQPTSAPSMQPVIAPSVDGTPGRPAEPSGPEALLASLTSTGSMDLEPLVLLDDDLQPIAPAPTSRTEIERTTLTEVTLPAPGKLPSGAELFGNASSQGAIPQFSSGRRAAHAVGERADIEPSGPSIEVDSDLGDIAVELGAPMDDTRQTDTALVAEPTKVDAVNVSDEVGTPSVADRTSSTSPGRRPSMPPPRMAPRSAPPPPPRTAPSTAAVEALGPAGADPSGLEPLETTRMDPAPVHAGPAVLVMRTVVLAAADSPLAPSNPEPREADPGVASAPYGSHEAATEGDAATWPRPTTDEAIIFASFPSDEEHSPSPESAVSAPAEPEPDTRTDGSMSAGDELGIGIDVEDPPVAPRPAAEAHRLEGEEELAADELEVEPVASRASLSAPPPPPDKPLPRVSAPPAPPATVARSGASPAQPVQTQPSPASPATSNEPAKDKRSRKKAQWWEELFDGEYLRTVPPPRPREVLVQCDFIEARLGLAKGAAILDVGCGLGLHAIELTRRGYRVVGLDLSLPMLSRAADESQDQEIPVEFLHADMREMNFDGAFDAVLCWGTTFGYFDDDQNRQVIERLYRALKPKGLLMLDVVNRDFVLRSQPNLVWFEGDGCVVMEETQINFITSRLTVKRTAILDDGRQRDNQYSLRLYSLHELGQVLHLRGFRVVEVSGRESTPGVFFGADSPRLLIVAERRLQQAAPPAPPRREGEGPGSGELTSPGTESASGLAVDVQVREGL